MVRVLGALMCAGCAVGVATPEGRAYGVAIGQAEIRACRAEPPSEASCSYIRGGALSPEGGKAIGPLGQVLGVLAGLL
jgi:hypothetical protein